jgi:GT2 family glycosyltransferase
MMTTAPLISAIVANWNGAKDLEICLTSLLAQSYRSMEIVVVDNASTDDSAAVVRKLGVRWLGLDRNRGLAGALNAGAKSAPGEFVLFLNNDMRFHEEFVAAMVFAITCDNRVFSVDAVQYDWDGVKRIHLASYLATRPADEDDYQLVPGLYVCQNPQDVPRPALSACSAAMLVRKPMFLELGGFDPRLPIGYEDVELCWRAWMRGWKTVFTPQAVCWHRVGWSCRSAEGAGIRFRGTVAGRLLMATKLLPVRFVLTTWLSSLAGLARDLLLLRWQKIRGRVAVLGACACTLPALIRERREIFRSQHTSPRQQLALMLGSVIFT